MRVKGSMHAAPPPSRAQPAGPETGEQGAETVSPRAALKPAESLKEAESWRGSLHAGVKSAVVGS